MPSKWDRWSSKISLWLQSISFKNISAQITSCPKILGSHFNDAAISTNNCFHSSAPKLGFADGFNLKSKYNILKIWNSSPVCNACFLQFEISITKSLCKAGNVSANFFHSSSVANQSQICNILYLNKLMIENKNKIGILCEMICNLEKLIMSLWLFDNHMKTKGLPSCYEITCSCKKFHLFTLYYVRNQSLVTKSLVGLISALTKFCQGG